MRIRPVAVAAVWISVVGVALWRLRQPGSRADGLEQPFSEEPPGRPRFVLPAGGTAEHGSAVSQGTEQELVLWVGRTTIGRNAKADLRLHEATVSLWHAEVTVNGEGVVQVTDLGAQNGVRVDGRPVAQVQLTDGNRLELGEVVLVFKSDLALGAPGRQGGELG